MDKPIKILYLEDSAELAEPYKEFLESIGYEVTHVTSLFEAINLVDTNYLQFDLLLSDNDLADKNQGLHFLELYRDRFKCAVIYSAMDDIAFRVKELEAEFVAKPALMATLNNTIERGLKAANTRELLGKAK